MSMDSPISPHFANRKVLREKEIDLKLNFDRNVHCLLGLPFEALSMEDAVQRVKRSAREQTPCFVSTPNLNFLIACQSDPQFRDSIINSDMSIADGMPLIWLARLLDIPIKERVAGSDLFEQLRSETSTPMAVYFFGGPEGVAEAAFRQLNAQIGGMKCVGFESPGFGSIEEMSSAATIDRINASGADFLVVALGARKGQAWIERNRARISVPVISHLGAVVNFVSGTLDRAPPWMRNSGLEWLWRIKEEPGLWRRYLADGIGLLKLLLTQVFRYAWYLRWHRPTALALQQASTRTSCSGEMTTILLSGAWVGENLGPLRQCFAQAAINESDIQLDLRDVSYIDSAFLGLVLLLYRAQTAVGRRMRIHTGAKLRRFFDFAGADFLLATD